MKERIKEELGYFGEYAKEMTIVYVITRIVAEIICWIIDRFESP